jgi:integrase
MARPKRDSVVDLSKPQELTAGLIERLTCPPGKDQAFLRDSKAPGLRVRVTASGFKSFVFETKLNGKTIRRTIGDIRAWSIDGPEGSTNARSEANRLRVTVDGGTDPREVDRLAALAAADAERARAEAQNSTLKHLLDQYCDYLEGLGRISHREARSVFRVHVFTPWPEIANMPANKVSVEQIADMMRRVFESEKRRTSNILRSYLRAAYEVAKQAKSKASIPMAFKAFNIQGNPAAETSPDSEANQPAKNPLTVQDMRTYWNTIKSMDGNRGALLRFHLLTGGQRLEQLVRLKTRDIDGNTIAIYDGKGKPGKPPRKHIVPLIPAALKALQGCAPVGEFALSSNGGKTHIASETLSEWAAIAGAEIQAFQTKRLRSGVETLLSIWQVSQDTRGQLQSHGISGVQSRHYDGNDFMDVKRAALLLLFNVLEMPEASNVVPLIAAA